MTIIEPQIDLGAIVETLTLRFAKVADRQHVNDLVSTAAAGFATARVREYIPVLVQHLCADQLRQLPPVQPHSPTNTTTS